MVQCIRSEEHAVQKEDANGRHDRRKSAQETHGRKDPGNARRRNDDPQRLRPDVRDIEQSHQPVGPKERGVRMLVKLDPQQG